MSHQSGRPLWSSNRPWWPTVGRLPWPFPFLCQVWPNLSLWTFLESTNWCWLWYCLFMFLFFCSTFPFFRVKDIVPEKNYTISQALDFANQNWQRSKAQHFSRISPLRWLEYPYQLAVEKLQCIGIIYPNMCNQLYLSMSTWLTNLSHTFWLVIFLLFKFLNFFLQRTNFYQWSHIWWRVSGNFWRSDQPQRCVGWLWGQCIPECKCINHYICCQQPQRQKQAWEGNGLGESLYWVYEELC